MGVTVDDLDIKLVDQVHRDTPFVLGRKQPREGCPTQMIGQRTIKVNRLVGENHAPWRDRGLPRDAFRGADSGRPRSGRPCPGERAHKPRSAAGRGWARPPGNGVALPPAAGDREHRPSTHPRGPPIGQPLRAVWEKGTSRSTEGSRGSPRTRSPMMFFCISSVPPAIRADREPTAWRLHRSPSASLARQATPAGPWMRIAHAPAIWAILPPASLPIDPPGPGAFPASSSARVRTDTTLWQISAM